MSSRLRLTLPPGTLPLAIALLSLAQLCHAQNHVLSANDHALDVVKRTRTLTCGIDQAEAEYSMTDEHGPRFAFDRELCRAVAIAIAGPSAQVVIRGYPDDETALTALQSGEVQLVPTVSSTLPHALLPGVQLTPPILYDTLALLVPHRITTLRQLSGQKICVLAQTKAEDNLLIFFNMQHLNLLPFPFQEQGEMEAAFTTGNCTALAADATRLAAARATFDDRARAYTLLPAILAYEPLAAATTDPNLNRIITLTHSVLLQAASLGIISTNATHPPATPQAAQLLGKTHELAVLGLAPDWPVQVLSKVGNFNQIFTRTLGSGSPLRLAPGPNALPRDGGLLVPTLLP